MKWLANELAATAGELERIDIELRKLSARQEHLQRVHAALSAVSAQLALPELPGLVPNVRPITRYAGHGNLRKWLRETLQAAHPRALAAPVLTEMAAAKFGLTFACDWQRSQFRKNALTRALRKLLVAGEVERLHDFQGTWCTAGLWRWHVTTPGFDELKQEAFAAKRGARVQAGSAGCAGARKTIGEVDKGAR